MRTDLARAYLGHARHSLRRHHLPRVSRCLALLSERQIWWRPHPTSNSVGNLALHMSGNVRQWILSGLAGRADRRNRDWEFAERGPIARRALLARLQETVAEADRVLQRLSARDLARAYTIQGFRVTGLEAVHHVTEHFAYHSGQIIFLTKMKLRRGLGFTRLRDEKLKQHRRKPLPVI